MTTGEQVVRETLLPGAVLTRVAQSHVRVGTFQFFVARGDVEALRLLADYVMARHYPAAGGAERPYLALFEAVVARQAALAARWMLVGFIHGVMNTDNMSIAGETIDYGPCAFMDNYHPEMVYSSIDHGGRYAYGNQSRAAQWNLACLGQALLPLLGDDEKAAVRDAQDALNAFAALFDGAWLRGMRAKLGLAEERDGDAALAKDLLQRMAENRADFTLTFRRLSDAGDDPGGDGPVRELFDKPAAFDGWAVEWRRRLADEPRGDGERRAAMRAVNPAFIPRNHLVEEAIAAAAGGDFTPFEDFLAVLAMPYEAQPAAARYAAPPRPEQVVRETFCGT